MLKFGMPTLIELPSIEDCAALCRELGLGFVEMNMNLPQYQVRTMDPARFRAVAEEYGISYTIHLDENLNPCDFNPAVAKAYRDTALETIEFAKALGVPVLNMHMAMGVYFTLPEGKVFLFERYREEYRENLAVFRDACERAAGGSGIRICVENWFGYPDWQVEALDLLLESPVFGLTFDVGHNHCKGGIDEPVILERAARLCHIHLHDAKDGRADHLALGTGQLDVPRYLRLAEERNCTVVLETKTAAGLRQSVEWLRKLKME
ncbi:MAG: sugar phosphate isomerase/epimerase [Oscillospiraceae bacterium]|nr:sugar phosphate isomerase/epimerase [Oscillospiraceae bacterium]